MDAILKDIAAFVEECLGPLSGSGDIWSWLRDFVIQLIATLLLFIVIKIFLWKPITKFLEDRRNKMDEALNEAEAARLKSLELEASYQEKFEAARIEIQKLLKDAVSLGNRKADEIIEAAKLQASRLITLAHEEIEREIAQQETEIKNQIVSIAFLAAEQIVGHEINQEQYLETVTKIIESGIKDE